MISYIFFVCVLSSLTANCELLVRPSGWLDRLVQYHKEKFTQDVIKEVPFKIKVELMPIPQGYKDSGDWSPAAVHRLMQLIAASDNEAIKTQLQSLLAPSRRHMSRMKTYKHFPSIYKKEDFYFYYDVEHLVEDETSPNPLEPSPIPPSDYMLHISNPLEAKLPSAQISVGELRKILMVRAHAARMMPTTIRTTVSTVSRQSITTGAAATSEAATDSGTDQATDEMTAGGETNAEAGTTNQADGAV